MSLAIRLIALPLSLLPGLAGAGVVASVWPGAAPCNTTLQACIDATPNGGAVSIATDTPIAENINLYNRSISLFPATGRKPNFAPGNWISVTSAAILGDQNVTLRGLRLTNAYVNASYGGVGTARYDFSGLILNQDSTAPTYLRVEARSGASVEARVYDNRVRAQPAGSNSGLIELAGNSGTLNAEVYYNQVENTSPIATGGAGIFVDVAAAGGGRYKLHGNQARGGFFRGGLFFSEGLFSSTTSNFEARAYNNVVVCADNSTGGSTSGHGIGFTVNNGSMNAQALNNTVTRCGFGISASQWSGGGAGAAISGLVKNNLVAGLRGLTFTPALTTGLSNDYNLLNVGSNTATLGANTITADARLVSLSAPRLRADSPAISAADGAALGLGLIFNTLPTNDADGLRRFKGVASDDADIGAYEYGDRHLLHVARAANTAGHITTIDSPLLNDASDAMAIATPHWNGSGSGVANDAALGVYYASNRWRLFNQEGTAIPLNAAYNTFVPGIGSGAFRHVSTAANTSGYFTQLDNGSVNNLPERIILVTQNWSAGSNVYNAHPVGLSYTTSGSGGSWRIANVDFAAFMPFNAGFNVYAQQASPNAFRVNAVSGGSSAIELDHPLLNDTACARPQVTRIFNGTAVPRNFDVYYGTGNGRWRIFSYSNLTAGDAFNVLIDPAQVFDCTDRIFANGFQ